MSRMLATKTSLSVRVDALSDVDSKSATDAPSVGIEYRAKLESRLRALEHRSDLNPGFGGASSSAKFGQQSRQQPKFEMNGAASRAKTYNTAADSVQLPLKRAADSDDEDEDDGGVDMSNVKKALEAVIDVKAERQKRKDEKKKEKEAKVKVKNEAATPAETPAPAPTSSIDVDEDEEAKKEKKRLKKEAKRKAEEEAAVAAAVQANGTSSKKRRADDDEPQKKKKKKSE